VEEKDLPEKYLNADTVTTELPIATRITKSRFFVFISAMFNFLCFKLIPKKYAYLNNQNS
jgi:hypothetical protein